MSLCLGNSGFLAKIRPEDRNMKDIFRCCLLAGIIIGIPIFFYIAFWGIQSGRIPDIKELSSGYEILMEDGHELDLDYALLFILPTQIEGDSNYQALKAQAVIARTNLLREFGQKKQKKMKELEETYVSPEILKQQLGEEGYQRERELLEKAIVETRGVAMQVGGKYIIPLYHKISIGATVSARELYGKKISYLESVDSSIDVQAKEYMRVESFPYEQALELVTKKLGSKKIRKDQLQAERILLQKTKSGYVKQVKIGKYTLTGEMWKKIFGLSSTNFYLEDYDNQLRMISLGVGHGLGLSQYGANEMAKKNISYRKILQHYYHGVSFVRAYK